MARPLTATLTEGSVAGQLRTLAIPMVWGLLATMSFNVVDTFYVAQLGNQPLAAMSFTFPVVLTITSLGIGLGAGTSSAISRAIGEGDSNSARRLATDAISLTFLISATMCLLGWLFLDPLFSLLGATPDLLPLIRDYMSIWFISAPFLMVPMVCLSALRALGLSQIQGYLMGAAALFNALLDPLLIFGLWGFPALELQGAALATLITRVLTFLVAFYILAARVHLLTYPWVAWHALSRSWKTIVHVGVPAMVANVIVPLATAVVTLMVARYGTDAVAGLGVAMRIEPLMLIAFYALSGVIGPFFGQNFGAGQPDRLARALSVLTRFSLGFGLLVAVLLWWFGGALASLFSEHDDVLKVAAFYLAVVPFSYGAYGLVMAVNAAFNGLGRPLPAMALSAGRVVYVFLPLALIGQWWLGLEGIFIATALSNVLVGLWAWWWLRHYVRIIQEKGLRQSNTPVLMEATHDSQ
ncbi:MATE family efflux transporter [Marinimicrobium sp. ARAG 43.8]|uniref:MATE family efflux transporter n=1 Tax=Marinimicrobium sp. ARAG 43.8 TaxID=3418719 RepID=UPI003CE77E25